MGRPDAPKIDHPYVFSVSQVETFETCPRKWAFDKIDGIYLEGNKFAQLGQDVHDVLEEYLSKAKRIDPDSVLGRIAMPGIRYLPLPKSPGLRVEKWFAIQFGVAAYRGLKDVEVILSDGTMPLVLDHKTTRNFRWKKTTKELLRNIQAGLYAADTMRKTGEKFVRLKWVYYRTEGAAKSEPVEAIINRQQVSKILTYTDGVARRMVKVLQTCSTAMEVEPDFSGCSAYGGCGYRENHCKPKAVNVLRSIMAQKTTEKSGSTSSFLADLKKRKDDKAKKAGKSSSRSEPPEDIDVDDVENLAVNSPDREAAEPPAPPSPKRIGGKWVQAEWDDDDFEWKFPDGVAEAEKAEAAAKKAAEKKAAKAAESGKSGKSGKTSSTSGKRRPAAEVLAEVHASQGAEDGDEDGDEESSASIIEGFLDLLADKIAARLRSDD